MSVREYEKSTSTRYDATPPCNCQDADSPSGVDTSCGCIPGIPNFLDKFTIVNSINGMTGDVVIDIAGSATYIHEQTVASDTWTITHMLDRFPSVTVVDSAGSVVIGDVTYTSRNQIILTFLGAFSGTAYLN